MKKLLQVFSVMITFIVIGFYSVHAQPVNAQPQYNFSAANIPYAPVAGVPFNWRVTSSPNDEDFTFPTKIGGIGPTGFLVPFRYNGVPFTEIQVSCNGFMKFCNSLAGDTLSTSKTTGATNNLKAFTRNVLAPLWDDLAVNNAAADIVYQFQGLGGQIEMLIIEWRNVKWNYAAANPSTMFQVRLIENHQLNIHMIEYHYGPINLANVAGASASIGMNDGTPISSTTTGVEATGTFLSINCGGVFGAPPGTRPYHRSYGYEYFGITTTSVPDPNTVFQFIPPQPPNNIPLAGVYKVGGAPAFPNWFATLSDAAEALNLRGVNGPVTLNLWPGPDFDPGIPALVWDDIFHLIPVMGTSPVNTITVQVDPLYAGQVTIAPRNGTASTSAPSATAGDAMIRLDGTRYTTITGMPFKINLINNTQNITRTTQYDMGIFLGNAIVTTFNNQSIVTGARFNLFDNLYIDMNNGVLAQQQPPDNNPGLIGIRFGTNGPNADQNQTNSFNTIKDCEIVDFYRSAVYMFGFSSAVPDVGNVITGMFEQSSSKFHDANLTVNIQDCRAIEAYDQKNLLIENTDIYNIISTALVTNGVWGIRVNPSAGDGTSGLLTIRYCNVNNIENQGAQVTAGFAVGIEVTSPYHEGRVEIYNTRVYDIFTNGSQGNVSGTLTQARCTGMQLSLGAGGNSSLNVYNNYIYDLRAPNSLTVAASPRNPGVRGLDIQSASNVLSANVYYNTIYLEGAVPVTPPSHYNTCIYWANFGTSSLDLRNNILLNDMSAGVAGTGVATCLYASSNANLLRLASTTNNNMLWTNVPPTPNRPIAYDGNVPFVTLANYQTAVATGGLGGPRDAQAVTEFPPFVQPVNPILGGIPQNLHLNGAIASQAEQGALPIPWIIGDWDGNFPPNLRNPFFPDIGADEYNGLMVADLIAPQILYTPIPTQNNPAGATLSVTITDRSGIPPIGPPNGPTLYYRKSFPVVTPWFANQVPAIGPPNTYIWTINYANVGGAIPGDVFQYYVGAQDNLGNVGTNPSGGAGTPPPGNVPPATLNQFTFVAFPYAAGTYSVGLAKFNEVTSKNLYPQTFTKIVRERVRVERNLAVQNIAEEQSSELIDLSLTKEGIDRAYDFDETKFSPTEFVMKDVVKEYVLLMENGQVYTGPQFVSREELSRQGVNIEGMAPGFWSTLRTAADSLNLHGISGPVILELSDAAYNGETYPIDFNSVPGVSLVNTITIKPKAGVQPVFSNAAAQIKITNTSFVTIDGSNTVGGTTKDLTINRSATAGQAIWIGSLGTTPVTDVTIKNCIIATGETGSSTPIMVSDGTTAGSSGYFTNISILNDSIMKGRQGIYINGGIIPQYGNNIIIEDNSLYTSGANQLKLYGIYTQGCNGVSIKNNNVGNFESTAYENDRGIWVAAGTINATVEQNIVHDLNSTSFSGTTGNGGNGIVVSSSATACNNVIKNNFIYGIKGFGAGAVNQNPLAIYIFGAQTGLGVYNNSIYLTGSTLKTANATATAAFSCGVCISSGTYADVRNNIIYNSLGQDPVSPGSTNGAMGVFAFNTLAQFTSLDYNGYYIRPALGSKSFGHINGLGYIGFNQSFANWKVNSGKDANSFDDNPKYVNAPAGDLHILTTTGTPCESAGITIPAVANDIDGELRNPAPDIGADEFAGSQYLTLNLTALIQGFYNGTTMVSDTMKIQIRNTASPYAVVDSAYAVLSNAGTATYQFRDPFILTNYLIGTSHRNALVTCNSLTGNQFNTAWTLAYDFTSAQSQANGSNLVQVGTKWCLYVGDVNRDGVIDISDVSLVDTDNLNFVGGYVATDLNGDTIVDISDVSLVDTNNLNFVSQQVPWSPPFSKRKKNSIYIKEKITE